MSVLDTIDPEILANDTAVIATISPAGVPQLTAVWYVIQDGHVIAKRYNADFRAFDQPGDGRWIIEVAPTRVVITDVRH
jgi:hypothetical protein